jgi:hypothetical protein
MTRREKMAKPRSFTLRLVLEGLCALVPDRPFFEKEGKKIVPGSPSSVTLFLPEARSPRLGDWEEMSPYWPVSTPAASYGPPHAPVFIVSPHDIRSADTDFAVDCRFTDPLTSKPQQLHVLDNELVSFNGFTWPSLSFEDQIPDPVTDPLPTPDVNDESLWWIPRMSEISQGHQWCSKKLLRLKPKNFYANHIAARLQLQGGHLSVTDFNHKGEAYWTFGKVWRTADGKLQKGLSKWQRAIGNVLACEIPIQAAEVKVSFESADKQTTLTLGPRRPGGTVEVKMANAELENLVLTAPSPPWVRPLLPDVDFQSYYRLTTGRLTKPWLVPLKSTMPGMKEKPCPMVALSGSK